MPDLTSPQVYQFKAYLLGISPMIWRSFTVPATLSLHKFHLVLQALMGWDNAHLYSFEIHGCTYGSASGNGFSDLSLNHFKFRPTERFAYVYDFSQFHPSTSWDLEIRLERIIEKVPPQKQLKCLAGARQGPREGLGGPAGYREWELSRCSDEALRPLARMAEILQIVLDESEKTIREQLDLEELQELRTQVQNWQAENPERFEVNKVNDFLRKLQDRWSGQ